MNKAWYFTYPWGPCLCLCDLVWPPSCLGRKFQLSPIPDSLCVHSGSLQTCTIISLTQLRSIWELLCRTPLNSHRAEASGWTADSSGRHSVGFSGYPQRIEPSLSTVGSFKSYPDIGISTSLPSFLSPHSPQPLISAPKNHLPNRSPVPMPLSRGLLSQKPKWRFLIKGN
jgi:hypothetical protein